jgi:microcystin-dependent protein
VRNTDSTYTATVFCSTVLGNTTAAGTGVAVPAGKSVLLRSDGTNIVEQLNHITGSLSVGGASTLTGAATFGSTVTLNANPTLNLQAATKQYVDTTVANGVPAGVIAMWSGTIATIPSGWALCNGSGGTPDLRDRFIVGASVDSGGQSVTTITGGNTKTGGSKDAVLVSHTHTASTSISDPGHRHTVPESTQLLNSGNGFATGVTGTPRTINSSIVTTGISASTSISTEGSSGTNANLVPYFALAYIMKT